MKRVVYVIIVIIMLIFIIPIVYTKERMVNGPLKQHIEKEEGNIIEYNYKNYAKIKLLHKDSETVEEINLDEYIANVVSAEMPANFDIEALKAQAVVARTYTIYKITTSKKHDNADICDKSTCCQAWISKQDRLKKWKENEANKNWSKIIQAVNETVGQIIVYEDKPINAFFHSNSGRKDRNTILCVGWKRISIFTSC